MVLLDFRQDCDSLELNIEKVESTFPIIAILSGFLFLSSFSIVFDRGMLKMRALPLFILLFLLF